MVQKDSLQRSNSMQASKKKEEEEEMKQQKMKTMINMIRKLKAKGRKDAHNSLWVSELLAANCKKAWLHPEWEATMQQWHSWLHEMKKEEEKRKGGRTPEAGQHYDRKCRRRRSRFTAQD